MQLETTLDIDLVAVETAGEVAVLLDLAAAEEAGRLLEQVARSVSLVIRPADGVPGFAVWNELPATGVEDGVVVELGDFHAGERRRLALSFEVPEMPAPGLAIVSDLELRWVDVASMTEKVATLPVNRR